MTLPKITNKQQEILTLLYQFRFLNRIQIQALLNHKNKKTINTWLPDLCQKEYIGRIYSTKVGESMKPAIYYTALNSVRYLKTLGYSSTELKKLYREKERSHTVISKYILIADFWLELQNKSNDKVTFSAATASDLADPDYKYNFLSDLGLDLIFVQEEKGLKKYSLFQIFEPKLPIYSIRKKISNYFDFYFSNSWEDSTGEIFPTLLFVCPDLSTLISAKRFTKKMLSEYDDIELHIKFTIEEKIEERGIMSEIWEEA